MKFLQVILTLTMICFCANGAMTQSVRDVKILSSPLGNASSGEVAVVHSTGLVYTAGQAFGSNIGIVDPKTNQMIKVIRPENLNNHAAISFSRVDHATDLVYFLRGSQIDVVDGREASRTFNQLLPSIVFGGQTLFSFAIDESRSRIYVATTTTGSNPFQGQVHIVDSDPFSATFNQILYTVALPPGVEAMNAAVNTVTNKIYITGQGTSGGVFVLDGVNNQLTRITTMSGASTIAVNELSNTIYSGFSNLAGLQAIDGNTDTPFFVIALPGLSGTSIETIAVNRGTERVYAALQNNSLAVIDAKRSSPTFNNAIANIPNVGGVSGEVAVHEALNRIVVASGTDFTTSILDGNSNTVVATVKGNMRSADVSINPTTAQAFIGYLFYTIQSVNLITNRVAALGTVMELNEGLVNPNNNSFYFGVSSNESFLGFLDQNEVLGTVGGSPHGFGRYLYAAQNKTTNRMYFVNSASNIGGTLSSATNGFVSVVDGATNNVITNVEVGSQPFGGIAVNEVTNKVYVPHAGFGTGFPSKLVVIDGATNVASDVNTGTFPAGTGFFGSIVANPTSNRIYFQVLQGASVGVINGQTDVATPLPGVPGFISSIVVNSVLNRVYFLSATGLRVLDGTNDSEIANIALSSASSIVVNQTTGRIYVRSSANNTLTAIDGRSNKIISTVSLPVSGLTTMAINERSNELYIGAINDFNLENTSSILFVDGNTLAVRKTLPIPLRPSRIVINSTTQTAYALPANASQRSGIVVISTNPTSRAPFDFDGDGKTDIAIFRPAPTGGEWWWQRSSDNQVPATPFGLATDVIAPGDFTGDGKLDITVWRPESGFWFILRSEDFSFYGSPFGNPGDVPMTADYDGDGKDDLAVFRPSVGLWFITRSSNNQVETIQFGVRGDVPVAADYDGDGNADVAIKREGPNGAEWWINRSTQGVAALIFGESSDLAVPGDYTGDGKADVAFFRPSTGSWFVLKSEDFSVYGFPFGANGDMPLSGDYDGDGRIDPAVFRPSTNTWFINGSTSGIQIQNFGIAGDRPIPNAFVR